MNTKIFAFGQANPLYVGLIAAMSFVPVQAMAENNNTANSQTAQQVSFDWHANGNAVSKREARARQAALRATFESTRGGATWVCTPAGFGQRSRCHRG